MKVKLRPGTDASGAATQHIPRHHHFLRRMVDGASAWQKARVAYNLFLRLIRRHRRALLRARERMYAAAVGDVNEQKRIKCLKASADAYISSRGKASSTSLGAKKSAYRVRIARECGRRW